VHACLHAGAARALDESAHGPSDLPWLARAAATAALYLFIEVNEQGRKNVRLVHRDCGHRADRDAACIAVALDLSVT